MRMLISITHVREKWPTVHNNGHTTEGVLDLRNIAVSEKTPQFFLPSLVGNNGFEEGGGEGRGRKWRVA